MKKLILLSLLLSVQSCFLVPSNCTVNLSCNGQTFSFDCMRSDVEEVVAGTGLNHQSIKESDNVYSISNCSVKSWYENGQAKITLSIHCYPFYSWNDDKPMLSIDCSRKQWEKYKLSVGKTVLDSVNVRMEIL